MLKIFLKFFCFILIFKGKVGDTFPRLVFIRMNGFSCIMLTQPELDAFGSKPHVTFGRSLKTL